MENLLESIIKFEFYYSLEQELDSIVFKLFFFVNHKNEYINSG